MNTNFNINISFWEEHEQLKHVGIFKEFRDNNGNDESTSSLMWFIKYVYHPDSEFRNVELIERKKQISKALLHNENFYEENKEDIDILSDEYCKLIETTTDRAVRALSEKIDQKIIFIDSIDYDLTSFEAIDKMTISFEKQTKTLQVMKEIQKAEKQNHESKGGEQLSESDTGVI